MADSTRVHDTSHLPVAAPRAKQGAGIAHSFATIQRQLESSWDESVEMPQYSPVMANRAATNLLGTAPSPASGMWATGGAERTTVQRACAECDAEQQANEEKSEIQTKLAIGQPGDKYEQEADRVAQQVVNTLHAPQSQTTSSTSPSVVQPQSLPGQPAIADITLMRQGTGTAAEASEDVEERIQRSRGQGQPLGDAVRAPMEQAFGADFSSVRIHTNGESHELNQAVQAKAFTTGQDIYFRGGAYEPGSRGGQELLAHELTHVVQQSGTVIRNKSEVNRSHNPLILSENDLLRTKTLSLQRQSKSDYKEALPKEQPVGVQDFLQAKDISAVETEEFTASAIQLISSGQEQQESQKQEIQPKLLPALEASTASNATFRDSEQSTKNQDSPKDIPVQAKEILDLGVEAAASSDGPTFISKLQDQESDLQFQSLEKQGGQKEEANEAILQGKALPDFDSASFLNRDSQPQHLAGLSEETSNIPIQAKAFESLPESISNKGKGTDLQKLPVEPLNAGNGLSITTSAEAPSVQRGLIDAAKRGLSWVKSRVVAPLRKLASTALNTDKMGGHITQAYQQTELKWIDIVRPQALLVRGLRNYRQAVFADAINQEQQARAQATAAQQSAGAKAKSDPPPSQLEQWDANLDKADGVVDDVEDVGSEIVEGAILGDFKENPSIWNTIGQIAIGFVPYAGQVADVRDLVAAINKLQKSGWKDGGAWFDLVLTGIGFVPGVGDIIKALGRGAKGIVKKLGKQIAKRAGDLWRVASRKGKQLLQGARNFGRKFAQGISKVGRILKQKVGQLGRKAMDMARSVKRRFTGLVNGLRNRVGGLVQRAKGLAQRLMGRAKGLFGKVGSVVGKALGAAKNALNSVISNAKKGIEVVKGTVKKGKDKIVQFGKKAANKLTEAKNFLKESLKSAIQKGKQKLAKAKQIISQKARGAWNTGKRLTSRALNKGKELYQRGKKWAKEEVIDFVKKKVGGIKRGILNFLKDRWNSLKEKLGIKPKAGKEGAERGAKEGAEDAANKAKEFPVVFAEAKAITEANDIAGTPASSLVKSLSGRFKSKHKWIKEFQARPKAKVGHYSIHMISRTKVSDYTDSPGSASADRREELSKDPQTGEKNAKSIEEAEAVLQAESLGIVTNARRPDLKNGDPNLDFKVDGPPPYKWADTKTPRNRGDLESQAKKIGKKSFMQKGGSDDVLHIVDLKNIPTDKKAKFKADVLTGAKEVGSSDGIKFIND